MKDEDRPKDLRDRTKEFALEIIQLSVKLPKTDEILVMKRQLLRSATSVAAHYREACRSRSDAEFISKMEGGLQELDESALWLELLIDSGLCSWPKTRALLVEVNELISIFVTIVRKRKSADFHLSAFILHPFLCKTSMSSIIPSFRPS